jgi:hypothetical protein
MLNLERRLFDGRPSLILFLENPDVVNDSDGMAVPRLPMHELKELSREFHRKIAFLHADRSVFLDLFWLECFLFKKKFQKNAFIYIFFILRFFFSLPPVAKQASCSQAWEFLRPMFQRL